MPRIGIGLLGDLNPGLAAEALATWPGSVWLAESPAGADPVVSAATLVRPGRPIGFAVLVSAVRHSWAAANACRTLAALGANVSLGLGTGDPVWVRAMGIETVQTVEGFRAEIRRLRDHLQMPIPPWARDHPVNIRLYVGCEGLHMTRMAAAAADGVILPFLRTDRYLRERAALIEEGGRSTETVVEVVVGVGATAEQGAASLSRWLRYIMASPRYLEVLVDAGLSRLDAEAYQSRVIGGDIEAVLARQVLERIAVIGDVKACAMAIAQRFGSWADEVILVGPGRRLNDLVAVGQALRSDGHG